MIEDMLNAKNDKLNWKSIQKVKIKNIFYAPYLTLLPSTTVSTRTSAGSSTVRPISTHPSKLRTFFQGDRIRLFSSLMGPTLSLTSEFFISGFLASLYRLPKLCCCKGLFECRNRILVSTGKSTRGLPGHLCPKFYLAGTALLGIWMHGFLKLNQSLLKII